MQFVVIFSGTLFTSENLFVSYSLSGNFWWASGRYLSTKVLPNYVPHNATENKYVAENWILGEVYDVPCCQNIQQSGEKHVSVNIADGGTKVRSDEETHNKTCMKCVSGSEAARQPRVYSENCIKVLPGGTWQF